MASNSEPRTGFSTDNKTGGSPGSSRPAGYAESGRPENKDSGNGSHDVHALRSDFDALKSTVADFMSKAGKDVSKASNDAMTTAKQATSDVAHQIGDTASHMATAASDQAKSFAAELERMGRSNPLGTIAGAVLVGVVIGLLGRGGRS
jgi:ElaB/YqjD/DUF883 family membrane-anchored ribosome-binding protein